MGKASAGPHGGEQLSRHLLLWAEEARWEAAEVRTELHCVLEDLDQCRRRSEHLGAHATRALLMAASAMEAAAARLADGATPPAAAEDMAASSSSPGQAGASAGSRTGNAAASERMRPWPLARRAGAGGGVAIAGAALPKAGLSPPAQERERPAQEAMPRAKSMSLGQEGRPLRLRKGPSGEGVQEQGTGKDAGAPLLRAGLLGRGRSRAEVEGDYAAPSLEGGKRGPEGRLRRSRSSQVGSSSSNAAKAGEEAVGRERAHRRSLRERARERGKEESAAATGEGELDVMKEEPGSEEVGEGFGEDLGLGGEKVWAGEGESEWGDPKDPWSYNVCRLEDMAEIASSLQEASARSFERARKMGLLDLAGMHRFSPLGSTPRSEGGSLNAKGARQLSDGRHLSLSPHGAAASMLSRPTLSFKSSPAELDSSHEDTLTYRRIVYPSASQREGLQRSEDEGEAGGEEEGGDSRTRHQYRLPEAASLSRRPQAPAKGAAAASTASAAAAAAALRRRSLARSRSSSVLQAAGALAGGDGGMREGSLSSRGPRGSRRLSRVSSDECAGEARRHWRGRLRGAEAEGEDGEGREEEEGEWESAVVVQEQEDEEEREEQGEQEEEVQDEFGDASRSLVQLRKQQQQHETQHLSQLMELSQYLQSHGSGDGALEGVGEGLESGEGEGAAPQTQRGVSTHGPEDSQGTLRGELPEKPRQRGWGAFRQREAGPSPAWSVGPRSLSSTLGRRAKAVTPSPKRGDVSGDVLVGEVVVLKSKSCSSVFLRRRSSSGGGQDAVGGARDAPDSDPRPEHGAARPRLREHSSPRSQHHQQQQQQRHAERQSMSPSPALLFPEGEAWAPEGSSPSSSLPRLELPSRVVSRIRAPAPAPAPSAAVAPASGRAALSRGTGLGPELESGGVEQPSHAAGSALEGGQSAGTEVGSEAMDGGEDEEGWRAGRRLGEAESSEYDTEVEQQRRRKVEEDQWRKEMLRDMEGESEEPWEEDELTEENSDPTAVDQVRGLQGWAQGSEAPALWVSPHRVDEGVRGVPARPQTLPQELMAQAAAAAARAAVEEDEEEDSEEECEGGAPGVGSQDRARGRTFSDDIELIMSERLRRGNSLVPPHSVHSVHSAHSAKELHRRGLNPLRVWLAHSSLVEAGGGQAREQSTLRSTGQSSAGQASSPHNSKEAANVEMGQGPCGEDQGVSRSEAPQGLEQEGSSAMAPGGGSELMEAASSDGRPLRGKGEGELPGAGQQHQGQGQGPLQKPLSPSVHDGEVRPEPRQMPLQRTNSQHALQAQPQYQAHEGSDLAVPQCFRQAERGQTGMHQGGGIGEGRPCGGFVPLRRGPVGGGRPQTAGARPQTAGGTRPARQPGNYERPFVRTSTDPVDRRVPVGLALPCCSPEHRPSSAHSTSSSYFSRFDRLAVGVERGL